MGNILIYLRWLGALILGTLGLVYAPLLFLICVSSLAFLVLSWFFLPQLLILLPVFLPFQPALNIASFDLASGRIIILILLVVGVYKVVWENRKWFNLSSPTLLILFFLLWAAFSGLVAENTEWYLRKILVFISIFPIYFLTLAFLRKRSQWIKMFTFWSYTALAVSVMGIVQFFLQFIIGKGWFFKLWGKVIGPVIYGENLGEAVFSNPSWLVGAGGGDYLRAIAAFPDPHMLAFYLGLSIPVQTALAVKKRKWFWILPAVSLVALLLTFSRGGYVGLLASAAVFSVYVFRNFPRRGFRLLAGVLLAVLILLSVAPLKERFVSILDVGEGSNRGRIETWTDALEVVGSNPVLGVGLGNYAGYIKPEADYREPIYAHNTYLDITSEAGLPALLAWAVLLIWAVAPALRPLFSSSSITDPWNTAAAFGVLWFSCHAFFETPIFSPRILPLLLILLAFRTFSESRSKG